MRKISGLCGAFIFALIAASCGGGGDAAAPPPPPPPPPGGNGCPANTVCMLSSTFVTMSGSTTLTVTSGTTVDFTNNSGVTHNVVFDNTPAPISNVPANSSGTSSRTFTTVGTYTFHCDFHAPGMTGKVVVQ